MHDKELTDASTGKKRRVSPLLWVLLALIPVFALSGGLNAVYGAKAEADEQPAPKHQSGPPEALVKAAESGDAEAQHNLGRAYETGRGVAKDEAQALAWYRKAAAQGWEDAIARLEELGESLSDERADAADPDDPAELYRLGLAYEEGKGVRRDYNRAAVLHRKAAERGDAGSQYRLARMYAHSWGVDLDDEQAAAWYRKAAERGHTEAQFRLGLAYEDGRGVPRDDAQAAEWYRRAAAQGEARAEERLRALDGRAGGE